MRIYKGENLIVRIALRQQDGTPMNLSDLISLKAEINQLKKTHAVYLLGESPEIREGNAANELEIEITSSLTSKMASGFDVWVRLTLQADNEEFDIDPHHVDITGIKMFTVI